MAETRFRFLVAVLGAAGLGVAMTGCSALLPQTPRPTPTPSPTLTDAAVVNNTACLAYFATMESWYDHGDVSRYALDLRAIVPDADEFLAGQLVNFANALDGIESDVPFGQAEAISESQIRRVCAEAGVPPLFDGIVYS